MDPDVEDLDVAVDPAQQEQDIEDKLAAHFGASEEDPAPEEDTAEASDAELEDDKPAGPDDETEEVEYEGKSYKVPKELKPALLMREDYTRKAMAVADERRQVEDKSQFLAARQQVIGAIAKDLGELRAAELELEKYKSINWVELASADAGRAFALSEQRKELERTVGQTQQRIRGTLAQADEATKQHQAYQWKLAVEGARKAMGKVSPTDDLAAAQLVKDMGFAEADPRLADARVLELVIDAARWRRLQAGKPELNKRAEQVRPMRAVSRSAPQTQREGRLSATRQALAKTGSAQAAEDHLTLLYSRK